MGLGKEAVGALLGKRILMNSNRDADVYKYRALEATPGGMTFLFFVLGVH
jgi:hypothetical protein